MLFSFLFCVYLLLLLLLSLLMFKVPSISSQTTTPLIHCRTDDDVIQVAPLLYLRLSSAVVSTKFEAMLCLKIQLITSLNQNLALS